jgi:transposase
VGVCDGDHDGAGGLRRDDLSTILEVQRFARHLTVELPALFGFPVDPALDATNWHAEQALRRAVITRKVCGGGNRSRRGTDAERAKQELRKAFRRT